MTVAVPEESQISESLDKDFKANLSSIFKELWKDKEQNEIRKSMCEQNENINRNYKKEVLS